LSFQERLFQVKLLRPVNRLVQVNAKADGQAIFVHFVVAARYGAAGGALNMMAKVSRTLRLRDALQLFGGAAMHPIIFWLCVTGIWPEGGAGDQDNGDFAGKMYAHCVSPRESPMAFFP
jgi:hypothetical protein